MFKNSLIFTTNIGCTGNVKKIMLDVTATQVEAKLQTALSQLSRRGLPTAVMSDLYLENGKIYIV